MTWLMPAAGLALLVLTGTSLRAQQSDTPMKLGFLVSGGVVTQFASDDGDPLVGGTLGAGAEILTGWGVKLRAEGALSRFIGGRTAGVACPGIGCAPPETAPSLIAATASGAFRPLPSRRFYAIVGIGFYSALGAESRYDTRSEGVSAGVGWALSDWDRGPGIEARYHWIERGVGLTTAILPIMVTYRF